MIYGGVQDLTLFIAPEGDLAPVPSWHSSPPAAGLICGLIVLASAGANTVWGWQLRRASSTAEMRLAVRVAIVSGIAVVADWICGYYGFGSLIAFLVGAWLVLKRRAGRST